MTTAGTAAAEPANNACPAGYQTITVSELVEMDEVAHMLGLANGRVVSVCRVRYADFPEPAIEKGRCLLWFRADIERWAKATGRLPRP